jgi:hypothetical protein
LKIILILLILKEEAFLENQLHEKKFIYSGSLDFLSNFVMIIERIAMEK